MIDLDAAAARQVPGLWACGTVVRFDAGRPQSELPDPDRLMDPSWSLDNLKDHEVAAAFRKVSWAVGVDPTKNRPSGEALARRILGGKPLPRIHPLVDAYNLASASTLVPIGAYDLDRIEAPLVVRPAKQGDKFHGIGRDEEVLEPGRIIYSSQDGVVCGVLMWRDSQASCILRNTQAALLMCVGAEPADIDGAKQALVRAAELATAAGFVADGAIFEATS